MKLFPELISSSPDIELLLENRMHRQDSETEPLISIIVVSYNTREMTLECLRSVCSETDDSSFEVLFIDNQSTDGSYDAIQMEFGEDPRFRLVLSERNLGFAGANNEMAKSARGKYILLLNPDTVVQDKAIEGVLAFASDSPQSLIWGGRTFYADGQLNHGSCWGDYSLWSQFCRYSGLSRAFPRSSVFDPRTYGRWERDDVRKVAIVTGCFLLIETDLWERLGGFDPEFFMYGEEADLCIRARTLGAQPAITPAATLIHHGGASEPVQEDKIVRLLDGETRLLRRHWSRFAFALNLTIVKGGVLLRRSMERGKVDGTWHQVWRRRREWLRGAYGKATIQ